MSEDRISRLNRRSLPCPVCAAGDGETHTFECVAQRYGRDTAVEWSVAGVWDGSFESPRPGAEYAARMREYLDSFGPCDWVGVSVGEGWCVMSDGDLADLIMLRHAVVTVDDFLALCYGARVRDGRGE